MNRCIIAIILACFGNVEGYSVCRQSAINRMIFVRKSDCEVFLRKQSRCMKEGYKEFNPEFPGALHWMICPESTPPYGQKGPY